MKHDWCWARFVYRGAQYPVPLKQGGLAVVVDENRTRQSRLHFVDYKCER